MVGLEFGGILLPQSAWWWGDRCTCNVDHGTKGSCVLGRSYQLMSIHSQLRDLEKHTPPWVSFPLFSGGSVSVAALKGKAFPPQKCICSAWAGGGGWRWFPKVFQLCSKRSWQLGAKK